MLRALMIQPTCAYGSMAPNKPVLPVQLLTESSAVLHSNKTFNLANGQITPNSGPTNLGAGGKSPSLYVDEVKFYDRVLTSEQLRLLSVLAKNPNDAPTASIGASLSSLSPLADR